MVGVSNIKNVLALFFEMVEGISESLEDGKFGLTDAFNFFGTIQRLGPALSSMSKVSEELADLDEAERHELNQFIAKEFDIANDDIEGYIEKGLMGLILIGDLIPMFKKG